MESFENSDRQQQRRLERQLAMQRMQEAATIGNDEGSGSDIYNSGAGIVGNNSNIDTMSGGNGVRSGSGSSSLGASAVDGVSDDEEQMGPSNLLTDIISSSVTAAYTNSNNSSKRHINKSWNNSFNAPSKTASFRNRILDSASAKQFLWDDCSSVGTSRCEFSCSVGSLSLYDVSSCNLISSFTIISHSQSSQSSRH